MINIKTYVCTECSTKHKNIDAEYFDIPLFDKPAFKYICSVCKNQDIFSVKKKHKDNLEVDTHLTKKDIINYYEIELMQKQMAECSRKEYKNMILEKYNKYKKVIKNL